jgi:hypothetical protein
MAWLFVRLFDNGLVDDAAHHFAGNADMRHLLTLAVDSHGAPSVLKRVFAPGNPPPQGLALLGGVIDEGVDRLAAQRHAAGVRFPP